MCYSSQRLKMRDVSNTISYVYHLLYLARFKQLNYNDDKNVHLQPSIKNICMTFYSFEKTQLISMLPNAHFTMDSEGMSNHISVEIYRTENSELGYLIFLNAKCT